MGRIHFICGIQTCQRVISKILTHNRSTLALAFKHVNYDKQGDIVLAQVSTWDGEVYLFDLKEMPDLMHSGQLWRLIQAPSILKVMHDCRTCSVVLKRQFGVTLSNVFDTQAAYSLKMMQNNLPPRQVYLQALYQKYGDSAQTKGNDMLKHTQNTNSGIYWAQRPVSREMLATAAASVLLLLPDVYQNMASEIRDEDKDMFHELCAAYINNGKSLSQPSNKSQAKDIGNRPKSQPIVKLRASQKMLLKGTTPGVYM